MYKWESMYKKGSKVEVKQGDTFNDWTVTEKGAYTKVNEKGNIISYVEVQCKCGYKKESRKYSIIRGVVKKCRNCKKKEGFNNGRFSGYQDIGGYYVGQLREGAYRRGLEFNINPKQMWSLLVEQDFKCALSGLPITVSRSIVNKKNNQTASLDRIDSRRGYTKDNIQWVHKEINQMKSCRKDEDFIFLCKAVALHNGLK